MKVRSIIREELGKGSAGMTERSWGGRPGFFETKRG